MSTGIGNISGGEVKSLLKNYPNAIYESLLGNALSNKNLVVLKDHCIIMRKDHRFMRGTVKLVGGGGAGTDPAEAYYVGKGMLTAAVVGDFFTAPCINEILIALRELAIEHSDGILLLVKNYIGDKTNFGLALERAQSENISVKMLLIGDNAFESAKDKHGKKGFAGAAMVYKIIGEMAEQGKSMEDIIEECRENIIPDLATVSVTYSSWNNIILNPLGRLIGPQEMVLGIGVYGNGGAKKIQRTDLKSTVSLVLEEVLWSLQLKLDLFEYEVIVLINNLGALNKVEEAIICKEVFGQLRDLQIQVAELLVGTFMASKNPEGFSISILKLNSKDIIKYLRAPTTAPGWPKTAFEDIGEILFVDSPIVLPLLNHDQLNNAKFENMSFSPFFSKTAPAALKQILVFASEALISCEKQLNIIDSETGDGDIGTMLKKGAEALRKALLNNEMDLIFPGKLLLQISEICSQFIGGMTGAMSTAFFSAASKALQNSKEISPEICAAAFKAGIKAVQHYGRAELGERTILDVLIPVGDTFEAALINGKTFSQAVYLAVTTSEFKSEETKTLKSPILERLDVDQPLIYADAGCHAITIWLRAVCEGLKLHYPLESFDDEAPTVKPGIFLWMFLSESESNFILRNDVSYPEIMCLTEKKLETGQRLLLDLLLEAIKYCRERYKDPKRVSALVGTFYFTHQYFTASRWRTPPEVYLYFRESILCQSFESPPKCAEIFDPEEAKDALLFFFETYLRNLPLISVVHLPHYKLQLKIQEDGGSLNEKNDISNDGKNN